MIAALYVERDGVYWDLPGVDAWDKERDARLYAGPWPVVAHPPCERWGRMWFGSPLKPDPEKYRRGNDGGCFHMALFAVRNFGGVLEHPEASGAWDWFGLNRPPRSGGWVNADMQGGWTCYVEQGHYGHVGRKGTWLYAHDVDLPSLKWGSSGQRLDPIAVERYGYEKARRSGITGHIGAKFKKDHRGRTPIEFRDLLISIAQSVSPEALTPQTPTEQGARPASAPSMQGATSPELLAAEHR